MRYLFGDVTRLYRPNEGRNGRTSSGAKEQNGRQHNIQLCAQGTSLKSVLSTVLLRLRSTRKHLHLTFYVFLDLYYNIQRSYFFGLKKLKGDMTLFQVNIKYLTTSARYHYLPYKQLIQSGRTACRTPSVIIAKFDITENRSMKIIYLYHPVLIMYRKYAN